MEGAVDIGRCIWAALVGEPNRRGGPFEIRSLRLTLATLVALALALPTGASATGTRRVGHAKITGSRCSNNKPRYCVLHVIYKDRIGEPERHWLLSIPMCESGWDPLNTNGSSDGLYQFQPPTWAETPQGAGHPERIWSAYWQAFAAHWGYHHFEHGPGEWACTSILGL